MRKKSRKKNRFCVILTIAGCVVLVIVFVCLEWFLKRERTDGQAAVAEKAEELGHDAWNTDAELSKVKQIENEEVVCYEDRAFYRFTYEEDSVMNTSRIVKGLLQKCPDLQMVYVMPIPKRVLIEEGYEEDNSKYEDYLSSLRNCMPDKGALLDASEEILKHKEEAVFFPSEDAWSARGAYYGARVFLEKTQRKCVPLEQYEAYVGDMFSGNLLFQKDISKLSGEQSVLLQNTLDYYWQKDFPQLAEIILLDDNGIEESYKKPLFTPSSANLASVIEKDYTRAIVKGNSMDGKETDKHLLVICDDAGKLVVPYLKDYYEGICVINMYEDAFFYRDINRIIGEYHITEVVWVQNAMHMGERGFSRAVSDFLEEG